MFKVGIAPFIEERAPQGGRNWAPLTLTVFFLKGKDARSQRPVAHRCNHILANTKYSNRRLISKYRPHVTITRHDGLIYCIISLLEPAISQGKGLVPRKLEFELFIVE